MPIFMYRCSSCGSEFEHMTGVLGEEEKLQCPKCSSTDAEKIYSAFSVGRSSSSTSPSCSRCPSSDQCVSSCPGGKCGF